MAVVRATIAGSNRPADLPADLAAYNMAGIVRAVVSSRGPGYGWAIEYDPTVFWDAVRANLRTPIPEPGMSWGEVAERDAAGHCPASPGYNDPHVADGNVCSECGAELDAPAPAPDYADTIAREGYALGLGDKIAEETPTADGSPAFIDGESVPAWVLAYGAECARRGYALGLGVSS